MIQPRSIGTGAPSCFLRGRSRDLGGVQFLRRGKELLYMNWPR